MTDKVPVLILGRGITALGVLRIFARQRIPAYCVTRTDPLLSASRFFNSLPEAAELDESGDLGADLSGLSLDRAVLLPCSDHWARAVAALDPDIRRRFPASVSAPGTLELFLDKGRFAETLRRTGTPHPYSLPINKEQDLAAVPTDVFSSAILKPRDSQDFMKRFKVKALHVKSRADAIDRYRELQAEGFAVILQEYVPGPAANHYFVDGFIDRAGEVKAVFVRQRLRMYPSDFGNSTYMISVEPERASGAVAALLKLLGAVQYRGMFSAEFKLDPRDGVFKVLEVNARAWWYVDFAARCGVDVCRMAYEDALERPVQGVSAYQVGRTLIYPYHDYFAAGEEWRQGRLPLSRWIWSWMVSIHPVLSRRDPMPFTRFALGTLGAFAGRRLKRLVGLRA